MHVKLSKMVMWFCQLPSRFCYYVRTRRVVRVILVLIIVFLYCEAVHYYVVLLWCTWPVLGAEYVTEGMPIVTDTKPLRVMFIGDTHLLGSDVHWFDKIRREWQMERSFQASMLIHSPDVVFILGDVLDNGKQCSKEEFDNHVRRFKKMFHTPLTTRTEIVVGNHDIGFHYRMTNDKLERFVESFSAPSVKLMQIEGVTFILVNSMALEGDGCNICKDAEDKLRDIKWKLKCAKGLEEKKSVADVCDTMEAMIYTKPILLQHFPMFRRSDTNCSTLDAAPVNEKDIPFREKYDCLSKQSTDQLFEMLEPRLIVSAHTHHGCYRVHENGVPEYTVASYNWRNKRRPTFLLAEISKTGFTMNRCYLPDEATVIGLYVVGVLVIILCIILPTTRLKRSSSKELVFANKSH